MKPRTLKSQNILFLWIVSLMILLNAQCILFRENPLDPNGDLSRLIGFLQLSRIEQTVTRTEWELLDEIGEPPFTVIGIRQISPPSEFFTNTPEGFPRFVLEQRGIGVFEYLITDETNSLELGTLKINVTENATEESLNSTLIGSTNYTVHLRDFFQGRESEVSPFVSINKIGQSPDGIDYSIGFSLEFFNLFGSPRTYLIRGNNPKTWEIAELLNIPDFSGSFEKNLEYYVYFLENGAFLVAGEKCGFEPPPNCEQSLQSYISNVNYISPLPSSINMRLADRPATDQRLDFSESYVLSGELFYKTIDNGLLIRLYRTLDGFQSPASSHQNLGTSFPSTNVRFRNPINLNSQVSVSSIDSGGYSPIRFDTATNTIQWESATNALYDPNISIFELRDFWITGNQIYLVNFNSTNSNLEIYRAPNPFGAATIDLNLELSFSRVQSIPDSILGLPISAISTGRDVSTVYYTDLFSPGSDSSNGVFSSVNGGNTWTLATPPRLNNASNLFYISRVLDGRIFLTRQSFVGMEYYTSSDGVNWERTRIRHRRIP